MWCSPRSPSSHLYPHSTLTPPSQRCMKDKVANVVLASLALFQSLVGGLGASAGGSAVQGACDQILPLLLEKLGDNNPKIR